MNPFKFIKRVFTKESAIQGLLIPGGSPAIYTDQDYAKFAKETYLKNVIAYRCIDLVAKSVASVPWCTYTKDSKDNVVDLPDHPINKLLSRPNPTESFSFLMLKSTAFFLMAGNSYWEKAAVEGGANKGVPQELYILRPDRMNIKVDPNTGQIIGYTYTANGQQFTFDVDSVSLESDILHIKSFHPLNDWYGLAATQPAAREIDTSNEGTDWNMKMLQNEARPGMLFMFKENVSQEQFERMEKSLKEKYSGGVNAGKNMILEGVHDAKPYSMSAKDIEFLEGGRETARRIAYAYGVPPQLIGIPGDNTYSNYQEARLSFWEDTIIQHLNFFKDELNQWLFKEDDKTYIDYNLDDIPALSIKRESIWKRVEEASFLTINEKREAVGKEAVEGGDVVLVPANMIPLGEEVDMSEDIEPLEEDELEDEEEIVEEPEEEEVEE